MGNPVAKLNHLTQLENFPAYITYVAGNSEHSILEELTKHKYYKPKGRPPFTSATIMPCYYGTPLLKHID